MWWGLCGLVLLCRLGSLLLGSEPGIHGGAVLYCPVIVLTPELGVDFTSVVCTCPSPRFSPSGRTRRQSCPCPLSGSSCPTCCPSHAQVATVSVATVMDSAASRQGPSLRWACPAVASLNSQVDFACFPHLTFGTLLSSSYPKLK